MAKKIILSVTNDTFADNRVHKMASTLHSFGHDVIIAGVKTRQKVTQPEYARIVLLPMLFKKKAFFYIEFNIKLFFFLLFKRVDVLLANDLDSLLANYLASVLKNKKLVYDSHELYVESPEIINRRKVQKIWKRIEKLCIKRVDLGITVSDSIAKHYQKLFNKKFIVIRNVPFCNAGVPAVDNPISFFENDNIILYQGSLNIGRGLETAIESFSLIDNAKLAIIGDGDIMEDLKQLAVKLKVSEKVIFTGRVSQNVLPVYTRQATIGLSIEEKLGKNYEYALPNKLFDYIHAKVPVIVSALPEMEKIVKKYNVGELFVREENNTINNQQAEKHQDSQRDIPDNYEVGNNAKKLASIINDLLNDPDKLTFYKRNCAIAAEELCWEKETETLKEYF